MRPTDPLAHLPHEIRRAVEITPAVIAAIVDDLNQPRDPATIRPTRVDDWAASRLMRIDFD